jgi:hypothetical protein
MTIPLLLGVAYAVLAALLLSLNLETKYRREIKIGAIIGVSLLYVATYHGAQNLRGWAIAEAPPNPFKLHWAVVEEPDKARGTEGAIFILGQKLSSRGVAVGAPRLYELPFTPELAEQIDEALTKKEDGKDLEARLSYKAATPDDVDEAQKRDGQKSRPDSAGEEDRLKLNFRELASPDLPPKSAN